MRAVRFSLAVGLTVLAARQLAYALAPRPTLTAVELQHAVGGPGLVVTTLVLGSLSLVAAALRAALQHVLEWMRRTVELLGTRGRKWPSPLPLRFLEAAVSIRRLLAYGLRARGPPKSAVPVHP